MRKIAAPSGASQVREVVSKVAHAFGRSQSGHEDEEQVHGQLSNEEIEKITSQGEGKTISEIVALVQSCLCEKLRRKQAASPVSCWPSPESADDRLSSTCYDHYFPGVWGLEKVKKKLVLNLILPLANPTVFSQSHIKPPRGILLHGPSGNGKSALLSALLHVLDRRPSPVLCNYLVVRCLDLVSKVVGQSEKNISEVFRRAREKSPIILVLDQIENLAGKRYATANSGSAHNTLDRLLSCLLIELDGITNKKDTAAGAIILLATTTRIEDLDPTILRPGRLDVKIAVPNPTQVDRNLIWKEALSTKPLENTCDFDNGWLQALAEQCSELSEGWSTVKILNTVNEIIFRLIRTDPDRQTIRAEEILSALQR